MLWNYLSHVMAQWEGDVVVMGDFNEILKKDERFGSVFNVQGADAFNLFIAKTGLEEVPLGNEAVVVEPNAMIKLMKKLKFLKEKIRLWNITNKNIFQVGEKLHSLEMAQKTKIKWAIEGDENSKYYHGILNKKRSQPAIRGILVDGIWIDSPCLVKREFLTYFKKRFEYPQESRLHLKLNFPKTLTSDQLTDLECEVSKDEIKRAVWYCETDKSPGPDGFTFVFYRRYWKIIESDVVEAVTCFFQQGSFPKGGNSSFITLTPKTTDANMVKDFRPISLIGSMYRIIAKILANRLIHILGDLVNEVQSAFVAGRQILDDPFILNEIVQWCKLKKKQSLVFKVDFEKAFDSVWWDYLDDILRRFGFGEKWCTWIQSCLRSSRESVIVNGSPMEEF
ncbi:RNA-directed DNA polymerase, eukaryota [Tanacetum coccineum]